MDLRFRRSDEHAQNKYCTLYRVITLHYNDINCDGEGGETVSLLSGSVQLYPWEGVVMNHLQPRKAFPGLESRATDAS
eukprot:428962-Prorocentrum_minimum.AAC.1